MNPKIPLILILALIVVSGCSKSFNHSCLEITARQICSDKDGEYIYSGTAIYSPPIFVCTVDHQKFEGIFTQEELTQCKPK